MNDTDQDNSTILDDEPTGSTSDWPSPGQKLKNIREDLGLSHARVAEALHMTAHYVRALEGDQYDKLPGKTFVKGYYRAYAKLMGADVDDIMQCYQHTVASMEETEESEAQVIRQQKTFDQNLRWMICAALIIVVVIGVSWWLSHRSDSSETAIAGHAAGIIARVAPASEQPMTAEALIAALDSQHHPEAGKAPVVDDDRAAAGLATVAAVPDNTADQYSQTGISQFHVNDGDKTPLHDDMPHPGEDAGIQGQTPFDGLIGDPVPVNLSFHAGKPGQLSDTRPALSARTGPGTETR